MPCALPCPVGQKGRPRTRGPAREGLPQFKLEPWRNKLSETSQALLRAAHRYKNPACQPVGSQFRPGHSAKGRGSRDVIATAIGLRGQSGHRTGSETQISPGRRDVRTQPASKRQAFQAQSPDSSLQKIPYIHSPRPACSVSIRVSDIAERERDNLVSTGALARSRRSGVRPSRTNGPVTILV